MWIHCLRQSHFARFRIVFLRFELDIQKQLRACEAPRLEHWFRSKLFRVLLEWLILVWLFASGWLNSPSCNIWFSAWSLFLSFWTLSTSDFHSSRSLIVIKATHLSYALYIEYASKYQSILLKFPFCRVFNFELLKAVLIMISFPRVE